MKPLDELNPTGALQVFCGYRLSQGEPLKQKALRDPAEGAQRHRPPSVIYVALVETSLRC